MLLTDMYSLPWTFGFRTMFDVGTAGTCIRGTIPLKTNSADVECGRHAISWCNYKADRTYVYICIIPVADRLLVPVVLADSPPTPAVFQSLLLAGHLVLHVPSAEVRCAAVPASAGLGLTVRHTAIQQHMLDTDY